MKALFDKKFLEQQKNLLLKLRSDILNSMREKNNEDIVVSPDQVVEEGDQAQAYLDQNVTFGLREREVRRLREVEAALQRIEDGTYGFCEETDEPINKKRLEKMPWTRLSIEAAEQMEKDGIPLKKIS